MAGFAITILCFYFSSVMDKLGRSASLIGPAATGQPERRLPEGLAAWLAELSTVTHGEIQAAAGVHPQIRV